MPLIFIVGLVLHAPFPIFGTMPFSRAGGDGGTDRAFALPLFGGPYRI